MNYSHAFAISAAGMNVESSRLNVAAMNIANVNTIKGADGVGYQPMRVVARLVNGVSNDYLTGHMSFAGFINSTLQENQRSIQSLALPTVSIEQVQSRPRMVYEPGHPAADSKGFVSYSGVDTATEMITLMSAMRSYEANVAAMNTTRNMALKALEIGGSM